MATPRAFRILVATDGSAPATAALATAVALPWPRGSRAAAVVARAGFAEKPPPAVRFAVDRLAARIARDAQRRLARRWPDAQAAVVDGPPADAIIARARRLGATVIVVGASGLGRVARMFLGSVSRAVVRRARCAVLVVRGRPRPVRRVVVGFDGSANARRAVDFVARLQPPPGGRVTLVRAVRLERVPHSGVLSPAAMAIVPGRVDVLNAERLRAARPEMDRAARRLTGRGWRVTSVVRGDNPLQALLPAAAAADLLVVGTRGRGGVARLLLGSVAEGALTRSGRPVLVVR